MKFLVVLALILLFSSCGHKVTKYHRSYAYNHIADHQWAGVYKGNHYTLTLIKGDDIWFDGF
ncbi:MAG: hypothetical protein V4613_14615 [Bacteroidota bacterium]